MKQTTLIQRRLALGGLAGLTLASVLGAGSVFAQTAAWPTRAVRMVLSSPPGTAPDIAARIVGDKLSKIWNQPVVIENRPGAGGIVAFSAMKATEKDDHQLTFVPASAVALSPYMYKSKNVDIPNDLVPVAFIGESPMVLAVNATSPINSFKDLLAEARKNPDTLVAASPVQYSVPHLATYMLSKESGAVTRAIPYPGSAQAISAVVGNDAQLVIDGLPALDGMIKGGRLKTLATFSAKRLPGYPNVPAVAESYPSLVINGWFGILGLKGLSPAIIDKVNRDVNTVIVMPDVVEKFQNFALYPRPITPAEFGTYLTSERTRWEKALKDVGAQPVTQ